MARRSDDPNAIVDGVERVVERVALGVTRVFLTEVRERNPVWTGHSRANWIVTGGAPFSGVLGRPSFVAGSVNDALPETTMRAVETSWRLGSGNIYVTNNVDYVPKLNAIHPVARGYVLIALYTAYASAGRHAAGGRP